jgi:cell division protein FtsW
MAVIWREFGLIGVLNIALFVWMIRRIMHIGRQSIAAGLFSGLVAQGVGIWMGFQTFINIGAAPTKGLTLPLMSYGGSAADEPDCAGRASHRLLKTA